MKDLQWLWNHSEHHKNHNLLINGEGCLAAAETMSETSTSHEEFQSWRILFQKWPGSGVDNSGKELALFVFSFHRLKFTYPLEECDFLKHESIGCCHLDVGAAKDSLVGLPPSSSNNTRMLPLGCRSERGTWYLRINSRHQGLRILFILHEKFRKNS